MSLQRILASILAIAFLLFAMWLTANGFYIGAVWVGLAAFLLANSAISSEKRKIDNELSIRSTGKDT